MKPKRIWSKGGKSGGRRVARKALEEVAQIVRQETILAWQRKLAAKKFDGSKKRCAAGRPSTLKFLEELVLQMARNLSVAGPGMLQGCRYPPHDRNANFSAAFDEIARSAGIEPLTRPPHSPNLNAHLERWNRSVKEEGLSKMILCGEASLEHVLSNYVQHFHSERNDQGKGNVILFPVATDRIGESSGEIGTRRRPGGLLKFYHRQAA